MNTLAKFLIAISLLLLVLAPGWTAFFEREIRKKLVLGVVLVTVISSLMLVLRR